MPYTIFPQIEVGETFPAEFDFGAYLAVGETISGATSEASVFAGTDPSPSSILDGVPTISGSVVTQKVTGGISGVIYNVTVVVTTSAGNVFSLAGKLAYTTQSQLFAGNGT